MNDMINLGKIVDTHGIKGELRVISKFKYKEKAFKPGNTIIINNKEYTIKTYRVHKQYDMITLNDFNNINQVLFLLKNNVYIREKELNLNDSEVLDEELMTYKIYSLDNKSGIIKEIFDAGNGNKIIRVMFDKEYLIPYNDTFIKKIDKKNKEVLIDISVFE